MFTWLAAPFRSMSWMFPQDQAPSSEQRESISTSIAAAGREGTLKVIENVYYNNERLGDATPQLVLDDAAHSPVAEPLAHDIASGLGVTRTSPSSANVATKIEDDITPVVEGRDQTSSLDYAHINHKITRFSRLQARILRQRRRLQSLRIHQQQLDQDLLEHDASFMRAVRGAMELSTVGGLTAASNDPGAGWQGQPTTQLNSSDSLARLEYDFEQLQIVRQDRDDVTTQLGDLESGLVEDEDEVQKLWTELLTEEPLGPYASAAQDGEDTEEGSIFRLDSQQRDLFEAIDDVTMLKEQLAELRMERAHLVQEKLARERLGFRLDDTSESFLTTFDTSQGELVYSLEEAESRLSRLRGGLQQVLEDEDEVLSQSSAPVGGALLSEEDNNSTWKPWMLPRESYCATVNLAIENFLLDTRHDEERLAMVGDTHDTATRINLWLLDNIRTSFGRLTAYTTMLAAEEIPMSTSELEELFANYWLTDGMELQYADARDRAENEESCPSLEKHYRQSSRARSEPPARVSRNLVATTPQMTTSALIAHARQRRTLSR